jgi:hypothetical protein
LCVLVFSNNCSIGYAVAISSTMQFRQVAWSLTLKHNPFLSL